jgi:hypothetical protein
MPSSERHREACGSLSGGRAVNFGHAMKTLVRLLAGLLVAGPAPGTAAAEPPSTPTHVRAGFAEADITPEIGLEMPGNYGKVYGRSVHDPCKVRVAVFDDGRRRVALVGVDALMVRRPLVAAARRGIEHRCGIPPAADHFKLLDTG